MRYFLQRLSQFLIVFVIVTFGVMVLMRLGLNAPGDPARTLLGGTVSQDRIDAATQKYRLDRNYLVQYWFWMKGMLTGDMGFSEPNQQAVSTLLKGRAWTTILLGIYAVIFALIISVPLAVRQAYKRDATFDRIGSGLSFLFVSVPAIVLAPLLSLVLISKHEYTVGDYVITIGGWFPRIGQKIYPWQDLGAHFHNFFVPTLVLTLPLAAVFTRLLRGDMIQTLQADFVTLASAKGVSPRRVLWVHALRNSVFSLLTSVGTQLGGIVGGAIIVEQFFDLDGMGSLLVASILRQDLFVVQSTAAILVAIVVIINLSVDLMYAVIDPRIRSARALT
ncbi:MAG: putative peptide transport system permease [Ilumatobacteraceae bacterium]|nr:putative peptide transport system permease [Ilumatobacteraceae bacterium]